MNTKNLPLKFGFILLLVLLSLFTVFRGNGLRLGIDLRGGYSLIYDIMDNAAEIKAKEKHKANLVAKLAAMPEGAAKKQVRETIQQIDSEIKRLKGAGEQRDLAQRMIRILKNRLDPKGVLNLEWRPMGSNRFEVRMPASQADTAQKRQAYDKALRELVQGNITDYEIRRVLNKGKGGRLAAAKELAGGNKDLLTGFEELFAARDKLDQAKASGDSDAAKNAVKDARFAVDTKRKAILKLNIDTRRLTSVLRSFVPPDESKLKYAPKPAEGDKEGQEAREEYEAGLKKLATKDADLANRLQAYENGLADLIADHRQRAEEIRRVARAHRAWVAVRRYLEDPSDLKRLIAKAGALEFRIAPPANLGSNLADPELTKAKIEDYIRRLRKPGGAEEIRAASERWQWFPIRGEVDKFSGLIAGQDGEGKPYVLLSNKPQESMLNEGVGGWRLARAYETTDSKGRAAVGFTFDELGAKRFARLTAANKQKFMAILLDDEAFSAPVIRTTISQSGIIEMGSQSDRKEVTELVRTLEAGALPGKLMPNPTSESSFGPSIGKVNRDAGIRAAMIGLIAVAVFMLVYYLLAGAIADVALVLNIILVLGAMSALNAVFTLPGIAGVILTIGIAVDANVLIFERLREEQAKDQPVRTALKNAYDRALSAIIDANLTTLITCAILYWVGTEEVKGFAITLGLGVAFSMFTALVVTRWLFQILLNTGVVKKPIKMLSIIGTPKINWMGKRFIFWAISLTMIVMGVISLAWQGNRIWGIEFSSGTKATFEFRDDAVLKGKLPNDGAVRELFSQHAKDSLDKLVEMGRTERNLDPEAVNEFRQHVQESLDKLAATARVETVLNPRQSDQFLQRRDTDGDGKVTQAEWQAQDLNPKTFAMLDTNGDKTLDRGEIGKMPSLSYQLSTTTSDVWVIRKVATEAFGKAQRRRPSLSFDLVTDKSRRALGQTLDPSGATRIQAGGAGAEGLEEYDGGVMFVIRNVKPAADEKELAERIRIMRYQSESEQEKDFQGLAHNETLVRQVPGTTKTPEFAILVRPIEPPSDWSQFAEKEQKLITTALEREEALICTTYDAQIAGETQQRAGIAVILSWVAIVLYVWLRFGSVQWGLAAVVCLIHDVIIVVGLVAVTGWLHNTFVARALGIASFKIDLAMIAAILTVIGYSVNDTIVVFDRIRENRGKLKTISVDTINTSINQTLARTLLTSTTTFIVVFVMYVWGGTGIRHFNYALLAGIIFGTYSSIAVASPLLMGFRKALAGRLSRNESAAE